MDILMIWMLFAAVLYMSVMSALMFRTVRKKLAKSRETHNNWRELAHYTNLTYKGSSRSPVSVQGIYRERLLSLFVFGRGRYTSGIRCIVAVPHPPDVQFSLLKKTFSTDLDKTLGFRKDYFADDRAINGRLAIESVPADFAHRILQYNGIREKLLQIDPPDIKLEGQKLIYEHNRFVHDKVYLKSIFDFLIDLADAIEQMTHDDRSLSTPQNVQPKKHEDTLQQWYKESVKGKPITTPKYTVFFEAMLIIVLTSVLFLSGLWLYRVAYQ